MPIYGAHAYLWIKDWNDIDGKIAIDGAARAGFDFIELPIYNLSGFNGKTARKYLSDAGISAVAATVLPPDAHMPENPKAAKQYLYKVLDQVENAGGFALGGCIAYALEKFTGAPPTNAERQIVIDTLSEVGFEAKKRGIQLFIEVLNRYETYLYNTLADTRETVTAIGADLVQVQADTYHMNIEEEGFYKPIVQCGDALGYIHISESHRGLLGTGTVNWDEVFRGLAEALYKGPLALEFFLDISPDLMAATKLWRPPKIDPHTMAVKSLSFMKTYAEEYNL